MHELFQLYDESYFNSIMKVKITKPKESIWLSRWSYNDPLL